MLALDSDSFHSAMATNPMAACILHQGPLADCSEDIRALPGSAAASWFWCGIDIAAAPEIAGMFQVTGPAHRLLVMRDQVVLYCGPLPDGPAATAGLLARAAALDMARVKAEIERERAGRAAIHARRACPTTWRTR